jgi:hypothetical protein
MHTNRFQPAGLYVAVTLGNYRINLLWCLSFLIQVCDVTVRSDYIRLLLKRVVLTFLVAVEGDGDGSSSSYTSCESFGGQVLFSINGWLRGLVSQRSSAPSRIHVEEDEGNTACIKWGNNVIGAV